MSVLFTIDGNSTQAASLVFKGNLLIYVTENSLQVLGMA